METCQGLEFIRSYHPHRWYKDCTEMDVGGERWRLAKDWSSYDLTIHTDGTRTVQKWM